MKEIKAWKTDDGKVFVIENDAKRHEARIALFGSLDFLGIFSLGVKEDIATYSHSIQKALESYNNVIAGIDPRNG